MTFTVLRARSAAISFLIAVTVVLLGDVAQIWRLDLGLPVLSGLLLLAACLALATVVLLATRSRYVMYAYGAFCLLWAACVIAYDSDISVLSQSETERMVILGAAIAIPILLGFVLIRAAARSNA